MSPELGGPGALAGGRRRASPFMAKKENTMIPPTVAAAEKAKKAVEGQYVEEGWVDKTCKICKRDTKGEPRQVDKLGRYIHVSCLGDSKSGNLFSKLFSR